MLMAISQGTPSVLGYRGLKPTVLAMRYLLQLLNSLLRLRKLPAELCVAAFMLSSLLLQSILLSRQSLVVPDKALHLSEIGLLVLQAMACCYP